MKTDFADAALGLKIQIESDKLQKWVVEGLQKLYPTASRAQVVDMLADAIEKAGNNEHEQQQIIAEIIERCRAVGHTLEAIK